MTAPAVDQQVGGGSAEPVLGEEPVSAQPVVLLERADNIGMPDRRPEASLVMAVSSRASCGISLGVAQ
jgi:hypothetical protein